MNILYNAKIYTQNPHLPVATALAIQNGRILAAGSDEEILAQFNQPGRQLDNLEGQIVIPGLTDAHIHLQAYALGLQKLDCEVKSREECLRRVAERARITPAGEWILGHGWNQNDWPEGYGRSAELDAVAPNHPVYLTAKSLHAGWANSMAMRLAGINQDTPDPDDGRLGRLPDGTPDGILFEAATELVEEAIPAPGVEQIAQALYQAQNNLLRMGLTCAHDFDGSQCFSALQILHDRQELHLRVVKGIPLYNLPHAVALGLRSGFGDDFLRIGAVKVFMDGALGPHTAAMLQPYDNEPGNLGVLMMDGEELFEHAKEAARNGFVMAVHAIGDRANHEALHAFANLRRYEQSELNHQPTSPSSRHRIEHVQLLHAADAARLAEMEITASMQPIHATSDMLMSDQYWGSRSALAYAWQTQLHHGATLAFGSDAPVESPNPFWGLHAAVTRRRQDGSPGSDGWYPEQRLTIHQAIQAYTMGPAYTAGLENRLGRLAPGYLADLVVLTDDPYTCPVDSLHQISPVRTMLNGEWVLIKD